MPAFEAPTINDFLSQLYVQTERLVRDFGRSKNEIDAVCGKAGATHSSRRILLLLDLIDEHVENGVSVLLGELRRALHDPGLDALELRGLVGPRLTDFASQIMNAGKLEEASKFLRSKDIDDIIVARAATLQRNLSFWLRQFDIGWDEPVEPEPLKRPPR